MIPGIVFSFLVNRALDKIASRVEGKAASLFRGELNKIQDRLERIERLAQNLNMAPLKSAHASLKLGDFDHAYEFLLTSLGIDERSPTTKFWMSMVLAQQGKATEARQYLEEALLRNPFVLPVDWAKDIVSDWIGQRGEIVSLDQVWYGNLHKLAETKGHNLMKRFVLDLQRKPTGPFEPGRIHQISFSGSHPIVHWVEDTSVFSTPNQLTALDLDTGVALWNHRGGEELCFSTPQVVVVRHQGRQEEFELLDLFTGESVAQMTYDYFVTMFCPDFEQLEAHRGYRISNVRMNIDKDSLKEALESSSGEYVDEQRVFDPFGSPRYYMNVANHWVKRGEGIGFRPETQIAMIGLNSLRYEHDVSALS